MVRTGLPIAAIVLGIISLIFAAYAVVMFRQMRGLRERVEVLEDAVNAMNQAEEELEAPEPAETGNPEDDIPVDPDPPAPEGDVPPPPVWQEFVDAYNKLAQTIAASADASSCTGFVKDRALTLLACTGHKTEGEGKNMPLYAGSDAVDASMYWAFQLPGRPLDYAVVPNPARPYDEDMHSKCGMKETFASNYESGTMKNLVVKAPALFHKKGDAWEIAQPGILQLS